MDLGSSFTMKRLWLQTFRFQRVMGIRLACLRLPLHLPAHSWRSMLEQPYVEGKKSAAYRSENAHHGFIFPKLSAEDQLRSHPEDLVPRHAKEKIRRGSSAADNREDKESDDNWDRDDEEEPEEVGKNNDATGEITEDRDDEGDARDKDDEGSSEGWKQHPSRRVTHGFHLVEGKMKHGMEDYLVAKNKKVNGYKLGLYAIFDGHSGHEVADYLKGHLFDNILNEPNFWEDPISAVKRAYKTTNDDILKNIVSSRGGSTAVTAILINEKKLVVANVGDSRAVLCRNGKAHPITVDHEPEREKDLVESKGGFVSKTPGNVSRVDGQLAMSRAFGDAKVKEHIIVEPDVFIEKIDEDVESLILASDGLWKVISSQDAVDYITCLKNGKEAAEELIEEALQRGSQDDISCVVVMFHR